MAERPESGVLDTRVCLDLAVLDASSLPAPPEVTAVTMVELHQSVAMAPDAAVRAARTGYLAAAVLDFAPLPFDGAAAAHYGSLVALTLAPDAARPRRMDLMIAAVASSRSLPLYTRNDADFVGLSLMVEVVEV